MSAPEPVLAIRGLRVATRRGTPPTQLVRGIDLDVNRGQRCGLIGESGSGKTLTAMAALGLLEDDLVATGSITLAGRQMVGISERAAAANRRDHAGMVFQEPLTALDPLVPVGRLLAAAVRRSDGRVSRPDAAARAGDLLRAVGLPDPPSTAGARPHQLSGGQRQRVGIALALACDPELLICDEPTTALDATVAIEVLGVIDDLVEKRGIALLLVSHDLAVVADRTDTVAVMYAGTIVESGPTADVLQQPRHHYTAGLVAASDLASVPPLGELVSIPGSVPPPQSIPDGCPFRDRCAAADAACSVPPGATTLGTVTVHCHHPVAGSPAVASPAVASPAAEPRK